MNTKNTSAFLRAGDIVTVRSPREILQTLDSRGSVDGLPFMPEMTQYCGKQFRVLYRVVQVTVDGAFLNGHRESYVREFRNNDVVILDGIRCSGADYDRCQRACAIFWKEAWLEKVGDRVRQTSPPLDSSISDYALLKSSMKTKAESGKYFCQSSQFLQATLHLSTMQRIQKCFGAVSARNISALSMSRRIFVWIWSKTRTRLIGPAQRGTQKNTPTQTLDLQPGELVEVKSLHEIAQTLNQEGRNRGLHFSTDQRPYCGGQYRVRCRADNFIAEGIGEMKHFRNTVILENVHCDSAYFAFGGCYRNDLLYWREIWLKRAESRTETRV